VTENVYAFKDIQGSIAKKRFVPTTVAFTVEYVAMMEIASAQADISHLIVDVNNVHQLVNTVREN
jgi:hypothetical protein